MDQRQGNGVSSGIESSVKVRKGDVVCCDSIFSPAKNLGEKGW